MVRQQAVVPSFRGWWAHRSGRRQAGRGGTVDECMGACGSAKGRVLVARFTLLLPIVPGYHTHHTLPRVYR